MRLFYNFWGNFAGCYKGRNWLWHILAGVLTYICVVSGFDWSYYLVTRSNILNSIMFPAAILGGLLPILVPLFLLLVGKVRKSIKTIYTAWALGQAGIIALLISDVYKAITGRTHPNFGVTLSADITRVFHFGFLRAGVFWGWPSSHTIVAFAMSLVLIILYPKNKKLGFLVLAYTLYIGFGVSITIHWFSDFIAGAMIGVIVGRVVGRNFKKLIN